MSDEQSDFDEPFDWSTPQPADVEPVVFDDDDLPFDPFTASWVVTS